MVRVTATGFLDPMGVSSRLPKKPVAVLRKVAMDGRERKGQRSRPGRLTIREVAAEARVSVGTASKALNGAGQLRDETRERVRRAARELGFSANEQARHLAVGRTFTVGMISTDSYGRFTLPIISGLEDALGPEQVAIMIFDAQASSTRAEQHLRSLRGRRVDGIVVTGRRTDPRPPMQNIDAQIPVIYAYAHADSPTARSILPDDTAGGALAAQHLLERGRHSLATVTGPRRFLAARQRAAGARQAIKLHDRALKPRTLHTAWTESGGREATERLLDSICAGEIDGIVCGNDLIARGVISTLQRAGVEVPDQVSVIGYDNWSVIAEGCDPSLSSVDMNLHELGRLAGHELLAAIDGRRQTGVTTVLPTVIPRGSS